MKEITEIAPLKTKISKLENQAQSIEITDQKSYTDTVDFISELKETGSKIKEIKESITKPLNEGLRNARQLFAPLEEQFEKAEAIIKSKILAYKKKVDEEARVKEEKIAQDLESGKIKKTETAEKKIANIERVETTTRGTVGEVQIRIVKKVRIINESIIPREYLEPNMVAIRRDALGGKAISGIEVYDEETVASR